MAERLAASDYVDVQISLDGATADVNDAVRGAGSYATAVTAMDRLAAAGFAGLQAVGGGHPAQRRPSSTQFKALADRYGAQLRLTRLRPSGRGADVWDELHPTADQQRVLYEWLVAHGEDVLTGDSFFHLAGYGDALPGLNLCGAGRVVCLVDPVGDVYACPFAIHDEFLAGNVRSPGRVRRRCGGTPTSSRRSAGTPERRGLRQSCGQYDACRGGCMAAKFFTGLPLDGPDPECVLGHGELSLAARGEGPPPKPDVDHSGAGPDGAAVALLPRRPARACDESPWSTCRAPDPTPD